MKRSGGRVIFTGPDGVGDYRPRSGSIPRFIGEGSTSSETTGDLQYLTRAAPGAPSPAPRACHVGEVGWGWEFNQQLNGQTLRSNMQIKKTEVRVALGDGQNHQSVCVSHASLIRACTHTHTLDSSVPLFLSRRAEEPRPPAGGAM
ncbi:protein SPMIP2 isoform 1-T1 [Synchiropus picturatus]